MWFHVDADEAGVGSVADGDAAAGEGIVVIRRWGRPSGTPKINDLAVPELSD